MPFETMADGESDVETINVAFRAVHSIKGGAGAFGLNDLVEFAHQFETVMDACRSGALVPDDALHALFLRCADMLSDLIRCSRDGEGDRQRHIGRADRRIVDLRWRPRPRRARACHRLPADDARPPRSGGWVDALPDLPSLDAMEPQPEPTAVGVTVEFRPEGELYESGNEPLFLLKTLADLALARSTAPSVRPRPCRTSTAPAAV